MYYQFKNLKEIKVGPMSNIAIEYDFQGTTCHGYDPSRVNLANILKNRVQDRYVSSQVQFCTGTTRPTSSRTCKNKVIITADID